MKLTTVIFPFRSPPATGQTKLSAARAWRIIAIPASDLSVTAAVVVGSGIIPQAPAGCLDGVYPVWVRSTDPATGADLPGFLRRVDGDGWHSDPQGSGWRIEYVGGGAIATDQFAYVVEWIQPQDTLDWAGQVNSSGIPAGRMVQTEYDLLTASSTLLAATTGRKSVEIYNAGPNSILVGPASATVLRVVAAGAAWALDFTGALYGKATVANQVAGAGTIVTEIG